MMKLRPLMQRIPKLAWALLLLQLVLVCLLLLSISHVFSVGTAESLRATADMQHIIINAKTGDVIGQPALAAKSSEVGSGEEVSDTQTPKAPDFDVAPTDEESAEDPAENATDDKKTSVADPSDTNTVPSSHDTDSQIIEPQVSSSIVDVAAKPIAPVLRNAHSLVMAPAPEITESISGKTLPKRGAKGITASTLYAHGYRWPTDEKKQKPTIALLVSGLGQNTTAMTEALLLPPAISFSFTPYTIHGDKWVEWARNAGHEVWLDIPTQTSNFPSADPGPLGIFSPQSADKITENLEAIMSRFSGYVGFSLPIDQAIINDAELMSPILTELGKRGLLLVVPSSKTAPDTMTHLAKFKRSIVFADSVLDTTLEINAIRAKLRKLETQAMEKDTAFAIISATPLSIRLIKDWSDGLKAKNIALAPVSAFTRIDEKDAPEPEKKEAPKAAH